MFGFGGADMPAPLDQGELLRGQQRQNRQNINQQLRYNRLDQTDQFGNTVDYTKKGVTTRLGEQGQQYQQGLAGLGRDYFSGASRFMANPADYSNQATEQRIMELGQRRLDPMLERQEAQLRTRLSQQGLDPTSEAYRAEMEAFTQGRNDAYGSLATQARGTAFNEALQGRNAQVGELSRLAAPGLQYGFQAINPNMVNVPQINVPNIDTVGLAGMVQDDAWRSYGAQAAQQNAMLGGLAGIGGSLLSLPMSGGGSLGGAMFGSMFR